MSLVECISSKPCQPSPAHEDVVECACFDCAHISVGNDRLKDIQTDVHASLVPANLGRPNPGAPAFPGANIFGCLNPAGLIEHRITDGEHRHSVGCCNQHKLLGIALNTSCDRRDKMIMSAVQIGCCNQHKLSGIAMNTSHNRIHKSSTAALCAVTPA
eukprot:1160534-Pelagomonas_calceolata.AAC.11